MWLNSLSILNWLFVSRYIKFHTAWYWFLFSGYFVWIKYVLPRWLLEIYFLFEPHYLEPHFQLYIEDAMWFHILARSVKEIPIRKLLIKAAAIWMDLYNYLQWYWHGSIWLTEAICMDIKSCDHQYTVLVMWSSVSITFYLCIWMCNILINTDVDPYG